MLDILACILIADFITGLIHWIEDTYGVPTWPLLGEAVIEPNILHHSHPIAFTMGSVLYRNYQVFALGAAAVIVCYAAGWLTWQVCLTITLASMGNEIHAWAHKRPRWRVLRLLQDMKLVVSPEQHAKHHRPPYNTNFCTITNWLNPLLDAVRFWWCLESGLAVVGVTPARMTEARRGY